MIDSATLLGEYNGIDSVTSLSGYNRIYSAMQHRMLDKLAIVILSSYGNVYFKPFNHAQNMK